MSDNFLPTADYDFILQMLKESGKIIPESFEELNSNITSFVRIGDKPLYKRQGFITYNSDRQVNFEQATGLAIVYGFMGDLLNWFKEYRDWSEGGYFMRQTEI